MKLILLCVNDKILRQEGCKQAHPVKLNKKIQILFMFMSFMFLMQQLNFESFHEYKNTTVSFWHQWASTPWGFLTVCNFCRLVLIVFCLRLTCRSKVTTPSCDRWACSWTWRRVRCPFTMWSRAQRSTASTHPLSSPRGCFLCWGPETKKSPWSSSPRCSTRPEGLGPEPGPTGGSMLSELRAEELQVESNRPHVDLQTLQWDLKQQRMFVSFCPR